MAVPGDALRLAGRRHGTPSYVTSVALLQAAAAELREAFPDPWLRAFSLKANDVPAVVARLAGAGLDANVVSSGEWAVARRAGVPNARITLEGVGKTTADLRAAVRAAAAGEPLRWVAVESPEELAALEELAVRAGLGRGGLRRAGPGREARPPLDVLLRLNPDVHPETHAGLAVGLRASKFGMTETELTGVVAGLPVDGPLRARGVHLHVGSQLGAVDAWRDAVRRGLAVLALVGAGRADFDTFDVGGGFPIGEPGAVPTPGRFAREVGPLLEAIPAGRRPRRLAVEPGRFLVAHAGWLVASVLHVRERGGPGERGGAGEGEGGTAGEGGGAGERGGEASRIVVLDTGLTELIRPAMYGAWHRVTALTSLGRAIDDPDTADPAFGLAPARVDGPVCESTDTFGTHDLPPLRRGDLVAIADAGAYAASMASTYNGRPAAPQILLEADGRLMLGRRRGRVPHG